MNSTKLFFAWFLSIILCTGQIFGNDWPHWRGPSRDGITKEESGYQNGKWNIEKSWQVKIGEGSSSPIVVGKHFYSFYWADGKEFLECRNVVDAKQIWSVSYTAPRYGRLATGDQGLFSGPCSTPEFDSETGYIYTLGSDGYLACWDTSARGKNVWKKSLYDLYEIPRRPKVGRSGLRDYGFTSSPLIHGKHIVVEVGAKTGNLMSFDKASGKEIWKSQSRSTAGHNGGPVPIVVDNVPCVAVHNHDGVLVARLDPNNAGKTVANVEWITSFANNVATVGVLGQRIIATSAYNQNRMACFSVSLNGAKKEWEVKTPSKICSPIIADGKVYFCWRSIKCLDFESGKLDWEGESTGDAGSMILTGDDRIICWTKRGDLTLIETAKRSPDQLKVLARKKVFTRTDAWPHVVLANGRLYCKDRKGDLACFKVGN